MTRKQLLLLTDASQTLVEALDNVSWHHYGQEYFRLNEQEEKDHDRFRGDDIARPLSIRNAARLFVVQQLIQALRGERLPTIADYIHCRKSWFMAHSLVANYRQAVEKALQAFDIDALAALDYTEIMNPREQVAA